VCVTRKEAVWRAMHPDLKRKGSLTKMETKNPPTSGVATRHRSLNIIIHSFKNAYVLLIYSAVGVNMKKQT